MLELDVALIDGIASRARRSKPTATDGAVAAPASAPAPLADRVLAAVFDDAAAAHLAAQALRGSSARPRRRSGRRRWPCPSYRRCRCPSSVAEFRVGSDQARRILAAYGGRVVANIEEIRAAPDEAELPEERAAEDKSGAGADPMGVSGQAG